VKQAFAVAWQHFNLYGRNEFRKQPEPVMRPKSFGNWLKSGSKLTPLWRRDPGLNLSGALCQKTQLHPKLWGSLPARRKISTAFAESAVNQVVSKRMVKKQQMRWSESGDHNLLQVRTKVLNDQLRETFVRWYPGMQSEQETEIGKKAA
jgi:hypothetical protein